MRRMPIPSFCPGENLAGQGKQTTKGVRVFFLTDIYTYTPYITYIIHTHVYIYIYTPYITYIMHTYIYIYIYMYIYIYTYI